VDKVFRLVRDDVLDATGNGQEPVLYGSLPGRQDFYFVPPGTAGGDVTKVEPQPQPPPAPPSSSTEADYHAAEGIGTVAAWDAVLRKHGNETGDFYVDLAREALRKRAVVPLPPPPEPPPTPQPQPQPPAQVAYSYVGPVHPPDPWLALRTQPSSTAGQQIM